ncbi:MAG: hypothetical protein GY906_12300 [bacterium]|nr:hypothetical protein [bacterium]
MVETKTFGCSNCGAPLQVPLGEVEVFCEYCASQLRFIPGAEELEVVKTREEMKYRERVAVQKAAMRNRLQQEEMDRWRETAGKVAINALPLVGGAAGRAMFNAALTKGSGCIGCGCLVVLAVAAALFAAFGGAF